MSILIKNMTMPETCEDCPLQHSEYLECKITHRITWGWADGGGTRTLSPAENDCPLVEIHPHGRLIDALEINEVKWVHPETAWQMGWNSAIDAILENAQTIIEADVEQATVCSATDCEHNVDGVCKKNAKEVKE